MCTYEGFKLTEYIYLSTILEHSTFLGLYSWETIHIRIYTPLHLQYLTAIVAGYFAD